MIEFRHLNSDECWASVPEVDRYDFDRCIMPELQELWDKGIATTCSCCGHGHDDQAYIRVDEKYAEAMLSLGYEPFENHKCGVCRYHNNSIAFRAKRVAETRGAKQCPEEQFILSQIDEKEMG